MTTQNHIPNGYKQTEIGIIPEDWEVKRLGEVGKPLIGLTYKPEDVQKYGKLVLRSSNIGNNKLEYNDNVYVNLKISPDLILKNDDLLICVRNGSKKLIGKVALIDEKAAGNTFGAFMSVFRSRFNKYIFYLFQFITIKRQIDNNLGATINQITNKDLNNFLIPLPTLPEQQAIARVLSGMDDLIEQLNKLIQKKTAIKKGAMQQLLTGQKRLPGFTGEWVKKKLGGIVRITKGELITKSITSKGNIPVIGGGVEPTYYHNIPNRKANTITISASGANAGYVSFHPYPIFASDCSTIEEGIYFDIKFIFFQLKLRQNKIIGLQVGGAQPHVYPGQIKNLEIQLPPTLKEQQAIAQILSDMDAEIEALEKLKRKYEYIKKGAMALLLTGKVRLKNNLKFQ